MNTTNVSKFSEKTTIAVMSKLKGANRCLDSLHESINLNIKLIEEQIQADFSNKALHTLLLKTFQNLGRTKSVASYTDPKEGAQSLVLSINPDTFRVTLTKSGQVRVCITPEMAKEIKAESGHFPNFRIYE
jgi:hypothetical protein